MELKYLYYFSCADFELVECKRMDLPPDTPKHLVYKWLGYSPVSGRVIEFDFSSMKREAEGEVREFQEGSFYFNHCQGDLSFLGKTFKLLRREPIDISERTKFALSEYLCAQFSFDEEFYLNNLKPSDVLYFKKWIFDKEVIRYSLTKFHYFKSDNEVVEWYYNTLFDPKSFQLGIRSSVSTQLIGYAGVSGINKIDNNAEYFIFIGDKKFWGKGIGSKVTKKIVQLAFEKLQLHRISLTASSQNIAGIKAYESAGFRTEGRMRSAFYRNGDYSDKIIMGMLRDELSFLDQKQS